MNLVSTLLLLAACAVLLGGCVTEGSEPVVDAESRSSPVERVQESVARRIEKIRHTYGQELLGDMQALIRLKELAVPPILEALPAADARTRANLLYCLGFIGGAPAHDAAMAHLGDEAPAVRYEAAAALVNMGDWGGIPVLIEFMDSPDRRFRYKAFQVLREVTSQDFGYAFNAPPPEREKAVAAWRSWWAERRRELIYGK